MGSFISQPSGPNLAGVSMISNRTITGKDILPAHVFASSVAISYCSSPDWIEVGQALASIKQLHSLAVLHSNCDDPMLRYLKPLRSLRSLELRTNSPMKNGI